MQKKLQITSQISLQKTKGLPTQKHHGNTEHPWPATRPGHHPGGFAQILTLPTTRGSRCLERVGGIGDSMRTKSHGDQMGDKIGA